MKSSFQYPFWIKSDFKQKKQKTKVINIHFDLIDRPDCTAKKATSLTPIVSRSRLGLSFTLLNSTVLGFSNSIFQCKSCNLSFSFCLVLIARSRFFDALSRFEYPGHGEFFLVYGSRCLGLNIFVSVFRSQCFCRHVHNYLTVSVSMIL